MDSIITRNNQSKLPSFRRPVISVKEARKILAHEASGLSDDEIVELLHNMEKLAEYGLEMAQVRKSAVV